MCFYKSFEHYLVDILWVRSFRADTKYRNQCIFSFMIYQGMTAGEIIELKVSNIDFDSGKIYAKGSRRMNRRHLEMLPRQYRIIDNYLNEVRPFLLKTKTDVLIIGEHGAPLQIDQVNHLVSFLREVFPDRLLTTKTIRQSVISNWLNEKKIPLEKVQLMAGHKWISSTERYRYIPDNKQRELINKFHPLG